MTHQVCCVSLPRCCCHPFDLILCIGFVFRWIYLNDQNLCIPASSSFVYGAVPIGASIYVIGDLDTGKSIMVIFLELFPGDSGYVFSPLLISMA